MTSVDMDPIVAGGNGANALSDAEQKELEDQFTQFMFDDLIQEEIDEMLNED